MNPSITFLIYIVLIQWNFNTGRIGVQGEEESFNLTIIHAGGFNDFFGEHVLKNGTKVGGLGRFKTVLDAERKDCTNTGEHYCFFVLQGNILKNETYKFSERIKLITKILKFLRPDYLVLSTNEYLQDYSVIRRLIKEFKFIIIPSNVIYPKDLSASITDKILDKFSIFSFINNTEVKIPSAFKVEDIEESLLNYKKEMTDVKGIQISVTVSCIGYEVYEIFTSNRNLRKHYLANVVGCSNVLSWPEDKPLAETFDGTPKTYPEEKKLITIMNNMGSTKFLAKTTITFTYVDQEWESFDQRGNIFYMYQHIKQDPEGVKLMREAERESEGSGTGQPPIDPAEYLAEGKVFLNGKCKKAECNLGNLIADAFVYYKSTVYSGKYWTDTSMALIAAGSIHDSIDPIVRDGEIFFRNVAKVLPTDEKLVTLEIMGQDLRRTFELALDVKDKKKGSDGFIQVSGIRLVYDRRRSLGQKLISIKSRCDNCSVPAYSMIRRPDTYKLITTEDLAKGAFGHYVLKDAAKIVRVESINSIVAVCNYMRYLKNIYVTSSERITVESSESIGNKLKCHLLTFMSFLFTYELIKSCFLTNFF